MLSCENFDETAQEFLNLHFQKRTHTIGFLSMKYLVFTFSLMLSLVSIKSLSQTHTARELYDEYHSNEYTFQQKYLNKDIVVTGKIRSLKKGIKGLNEANVVFLTATGFENFIYCQFPLDDTLPLMRLKADQVVTVNGSCTMIARDAMLLKNCTFTGTSEKGKEIKKVPADIPLGNYNIYQANGTTFNYQYKIFLSSYTSYQMNNEKGAVTYNSKTKVIHFTTGKLKGFTGIYRPVNPDNEKDPPTIIIDPKGFVPDLKNQYGKTYLLAYFQQ